MKTEISVLGFGDNVVDKYEHIKTIYPGGNCVNFAVYAKELGVTRSAYMGYFGDDKEAEHVIKTLSEIGIETVKCRQLSGENGCARVTIKDGERLFLGSNLGGIRGKTPYVLDRFDLEYIRQFDLVHSGIYAFMENEIGKIFEIGVPVSFDFSDDFKAETIKPICKNLTYAFISCAGEEKDTVKEKLRKLLSWGAKKAVATRGNKSAIGYDGESFYEQESLKLTHVIDTMGAGDSFQTAFLVEEIRQQKEGKPDMQKSLAKAVEFAAHICMIEGSFGHGLTYDSE